MECVVTLKVEVCYYDVLAVILSVCIVLTVLFCITLWHEMNIKKDYTGLISDVLSHSVCTPGFLK